MKTQAFIDTGKLLGLCSLFLLSACQDKEAKQAKGFALPKGDVERGKQAFVELKCHQCHTVTGEVFPEPGGDAQVMLRLGGEVYKVKTYGALVTAIINPQHIVSEEYLEKIDKEGDESVTSPMPSNNDTMTVGQMIDIVEFLHSHYVKLEPEYQGPDYGPPNYGP